MRRMQDDLSKGNAFTLGFLGVPHGYVRGAPAKPARVPQRYARGGFGKNNGTIPGLGASLGSVPNNRSGLTISNSRK